MEILRGLITEKMTAAVEEILAAVESTVAGYELEVLSLKQELEEIKVQHRPGDHTVVKKTGKKKDTQRGGKKKEKHDPQKTQEMFTLFQGILNRLTAQTFQQMMKQLKEVSIDTDERLKGVIDLILDKASSEPDRAEVYAHMCRCLLGLKVPVTDKPGATLNFKKLLLNRCQTELEKSIEDNEIFVKNEMELEAASSDQERQRLTEELEAKDKARRRAIGNIKFTGELFKVKILTEVIMHDCIVKLLKNRSWECLCQLLSTVGKDLDSDKHKTRMDQYFNQMLKIIKERKTSSRICFMLQDVLDLRQNNWVPRQGGGEGPENVAQSHQEQAKVQQALISKKGTGGSGRWIKTIRIRDPNQGGRDITEEIMSTDCSGTTLTPQQTPVLEHNKVMWEGNKPADTDSGSEPATSTLNLWSSSAPPLDSDRRAPQRLPQDRLPKDVDVSELVAEKSVDFTPGDESEKSKKPEMSSLELTNHLDRLIQDQANNQSIVDWIEANLDEKQTSSNMFVRALMTCICRAAIIGEDPYKVNMDVMKKRVTLLQRFLTDEQKELQALYALQDLMVQMEQPPNLLRMFFDFLYDEDLIKMETFFNWESSKDPAEQKGKGVALKSVTAFFTWLREAEEESDSG